MRIIKKGATSQSVYFDILDSTSTTGGRKTGLVFNTSSLTGYYVRNGASATSITLATLAAANSAWSSGGFKEVDATNMPGVYRLDVPDAAFASGAESVVITLKGATGMAQVSLAVQLVAVDLQDSVRGGMTAMPNAAAGASGGLPLSVDTSGRVDVLKINGTSQTARDIGASVLLSSGTGTGQVKLSSGYVAPNWGDVGNPTTTVGLSGTTVKTATDVETDTQDIQSRIPAALGANGNIKADVRDFSGTAGTFSGGRPEVNTTHAAGTAWGSGAITDASIASNAFTSAKFASGAFDAVWTVTARLLTAGTNIALAKGTGVTGFNDPTAAAIADAVWEETLADHSGTAGSTAEALDGAGGGATAPTVEEIADEVQTRTIAAVTLVNGVAAGVVTDIQSGLATATVANAIKAKTDSLTFTVAGQVDSNIQYVNDVQVTGDGQTGTEWGPA